MNTLARTIVLVSIAVAACLSVVASSAIASGPAPMVTTVDPTTGLPYEWQYDAADLGPALAISPGSPSVVVGIVDTGAADMPDLVGKVDSRWTVNAKGKIVHDHRGIDFVGHGSAVASLIAANGFTMAGFGGLAHAIIARVPTLNGVGVATALLKLDSLGVRIVNMSFGWSAPEPPVVLNAMHKLENDGVLLVAAAGNSNDVVAHPAADLQPAGGGQSDGLAVGASDVDGNRAFFSNYGDNLSLLAPGGMSGDCSGVLVEAPISVDFINGCYPSWTGSGGASYAYVSGTSFAAPEVAGTAALIWALRPDLQNWQVADIIKQSARRTAPGWTPDVGFGVLDAGAALRLALTTSAARTGTDG